MTQQQVLSKLWVEANNASNSKETRAVCRECAEWLEKIVLQGIKPRMVKIPFSWHFEARCGNCGEKLTTDESLCESCGRKIDWT